MKTNSTARARAAENFRRKREAAEAECDLRRAALRQKSPEFDAIAAEKESYCEKIIYAMRSTPENAKAELAALGEQHRALRKREADLLKSLGLNEDYLKPRYECARCSDKGHLEDGRMCPCFQKEINLMLARESGLFSLFDKQTFENFSVARAGADMADTVDALRRYAAGFDPEKSANLLFVGGTGVGKTHLSSAIGRVVLEKGYAVVYENAMNALGAMETERFSEDKPQTERLKGAELLILDDLGTELPGRSSVSFLYDLINSRLIAHRPTVLSTNLSARELEARYEPRIFSRLTGEYEVYLFSGTDQRGKEE